MCDLVKEYAKERSIYCVIEALTKINRRIC